MTHAHSDNDNINKEFLTWLSHQDDETKNDIEKMKIAKKLIDEGWTWHERYGGLKHPDHSEEDVDALLAWRKEKADEYRRIKTRSNNFEWLVLIGFILAVFYGGWLWFALTVFMAIAGVAIGILGGFSRANTGDDYPGAAGYDGGE